jgi:flagellar hook-length control protein FliK
MGMVTAATMSPQPTGATANRRPQAPDGAAVQPGAEAPFAHMLARVAGGVPGDTGIVIDDMPVAEVPHDAVTGGPRAPDKSPDDSEAPTLSQRADAPAFAQPMPALTVLPFPPQLTMPQAPTIPTHAPIPGWPAHAEPIASRGPAQVAARLQAIAPLPHDTPCDTPQTPKATVMPGAESWHGESAAPIVAAVTASSPAQEGAVLRLPPQAPGRWSQPLAEALGERLRVQIGSRSESAVIRLDPPMLGHIEIVVRHEAGAIQVQLSATHAEVRAQLQQMGEGLRHELSLRHTADVSVQVAPGEREGSGRHAPPEADESSAPGRALGGRSATDTFDLDEGQ